VSELTPGSLYAWNDGAGRIVMKIGDDPTHGNPCVQLYAVKSCGETFIDHRSYDMYDSDVILIDMDGVNSQ